MTCIVGLRDRNQVYIGADSAACDDNRNQVIARTDPKVFRNGIYVIGCTSSYRMIQILRHNKLKPPEESSPDEHIFQLIKQIRDLFVEYNFGKTSYGIKECGTFLIAWTHHLYSIDNDYQYAHFREDYAACGSGENFALGSLYSTFSQSPKTRIKTALKAATHFSGSVKPPFKILATKVSKKHNERNIDQ